MVPNAMHIKEFYGGYNGTCGETALSVALASANATPKTHDDLVNFMLTITTDMRNRGWASANGASTLWSLAREAVTDWGGSIAQENDYQEPLTSTDWHAILKQYAGIKPIVLQIALAYNLRDTQGSGAEAGVHYHFITVVGIADEGYVCADGDNGMAESRFAIYPYASLLAAVPCGLLMLNIKETPTTMPLPTNWKDANGILTAPNGKTVANDFRNHILAAPAWPAALVPVTGDYGVAGGDRQDFALSLKWNGSSTGELAGPEFGDQLAAALAAANTAKSQLAAALKAASDAQVAQKAAEDKAAAAQLAQAAAEKALADLKTTDAAEEAAEAATPPPPAIDPQTLADAKLGADMRAVIKEALS
jgi:hypothetical protein